MKITDIKTAVRDQNRVNISVDGAYRFSLDIAQLAQAKLRIGQEIDDQALAELEGESQYGKLYNRALEYSLSRAHSQKELRDYLWRKTRPTTYRSRRGDIQQRDGVPQVIADRVFDKIIEKGYVNDESFARQWVETRHQRKGISRRQLQNELRQKGVEGRIIDELFATTDRNDETEIQKIIAKRAHRYSSRQALMRYLAGRGFSYDTIRSALEVDDN